MGVIEAVRRVVDGLDGVTALWVTHRLEELDYADGAVYMENGTAVLSGCYCQGISQKKTRGISELLYIVLRTMHRFLNSVNVLQIYVENHTY